jgi:hypothetical protein
VKWFTRISDWRLAAFLIWFLPALAAGQYNGFTSDEMAFAREPAEADFLSENEKEVIVLINLARMDGKRFWAHIAAPYIATHEIDASRYTRSLEKDLNTLPYLEPLSANKTLYEAALRHARASGKSGQVGHRSSAGTFEQRLSPLQSHFTVLLENCDYGSEEAIDIVMNLMIDEGITDTGHRTNMLSKQVNSVGVAISEHRTYRYNCVQVFGKTRE